MMRLYLVRAALLLAEQLFFAPAKLDEILALDGGDELKAICADHARRLREIKVPAAQALPLYWWMQNRFLMYVQN